MKYNKVYYYDIKDNRQEFFAKNLDTKENIAVLKKHEIWDDTETLLLTPVDYVNHETKRSYFRSIPNQPNRLLCLDESYEHDTKVDEIYDTLIKSNNLKIWFKDFTGYPATNSTISKLQNYHWNFEVSRELYGFDQRVRFDLFGQCANGTISEKRPELIIEVIDSHFLDENLFVYLRSRTKQMPCVVLFYFISTENMLNKSDHNDLRISAFMKDGEFYYGGIQIREFEPEIQEEINNPYLYYNQINQNIIKPIRKGKKLDIGKLKRENRL